MNHQWTDRLSEYLDGELNPTDREALETHLASCADCRGVLADLRGVVARAQSLDDRPPAADLWPAIRAELMPEQRSVRHDRRRFSLTVGQLLAASLALVVVSGGAVWLGLRGDASTGSDGVAAVTPGAAVEGAATAAVTWRTRTDLAVARLEEALAQNERRLDTATVRVVRQNLALIDRAIEQAERALAADPASAYLNLHLAQTMRRKIELLRRANALAAAES